MDNEDLETAKLIQKLTGSNLDVKALETDIIEGMHQLVHTPKNGVREPVVDTSIIINDLKAQGLLLFDPVNRPT